MFLSVNQTKSLNREGFLTIRPLEVLTFVWSKLGFSLAQVGTADVILPGVSICGSSFGSGFWDPVTGRFARGSMLTSNSCPSCTLLGLFTVRKCLRVLRTTLFGVWIMYDIGTGLLAMTFTLSADLASHELSLLAVALEEVAHHASCRRQLVLVSSSLVAT